MLIDAPIHSDVDAELALLAKLPTMYPILRSSLGMHVPDPAFDDIDPWRYQALFHSYEVAEHASLSHVTRAGVPPQHCVCLEHRAAATG